MASELKQEADTKIDRAIGLSIALLNNENGNEKLKEKAEILRNSLKKLISEKIIEDDQITPDEWNEVFHGIRTELLGYFKITNVDELMSFVEKTRRVPVIFLKEKQQPVLNSNKQIESIASIEKEQDCLLSKKDFELYFSGDAFKQQNLGNCYLVSVMNSLTNFGGFEELIRKSVRKTENGFEIMMKLGMPKEHAKIVKVSKSELDPQIGIFGSQFSLIKGKDGIKALMIAYGKSVTGKNTFDLLNLEGGIDGDVVSSLLVGFALYEGSRTLSTSVKEFANGFQDAITQFDSTTDIMTLGINQGSGYSDLLNLDEKDDNGKIIRNMHTISVTAVDKNRKEVTLSNPWNCSKRFVVSIDVLGSLCSSFTVASIGDKKGLKESSFLISNDHKTSEMVLKRDAMNVKKLKNIPSTVNYLKHDPNLFLPLLKNLIHSSDLPKNPESLNQVIQVSGNPNSMERSSRGDVVVEEKQGKYYIESHSQNNSYITFDDKYNPAIHIGESNISFPSGVFSETYNNESNKLFAWYLYPPRLVVFLNKMKHDYIDKSFYKSDITLPFILGKNGECLLMDDPDKYVGTKGLLKKAGAIFGDTSINVLKDWSALGIKSSDIETKQKIIQMLNNLSKKK